MNEYIEIKYAAEKVAEYVTELLTLGVCPLFLKASFISSGESLSASYQSEGFRPLTLLSTLSAEEALSIVLAVMQGVHQCEKHYIFAGQFEINTQCIFVDPLFSKVKLVYRPAEKEQTLLQKMELLLKELQKQCSEEGTSYLDSALSVFRNDDYGYKSLLHQLEKLRREAYLCGAQ